ncbi:MAG: lamin tail domain-containing protein, partial [Planctomycetota bacterium]
MPKFVKAMLTSLLLIVFLAGFANAELQLIGDLNDDNVVDYTDVRIFAEQWLDPACDIPGCLSDLDGSDGVNIADFAILAKEWQIIDPHVVINEFMASNASGLPLEEGELLDGNGESSDWIEIYNPTDTTVSLDGWYLTDDDADLTMWQFPNGLEIEPGGFLIVFASKKTFDLYPHNYPYLDSADYYHTNFEIDKGGGYLALVESDGMTIAHEYEYTTQLTNVSYGLPQHATAIVPKSAVASYHVPTFSDNFLGTAWTEIDFPDFAWDTEPTTNLHFGTICGGKGLNYEYFEGYWSYIPNFDNYTPIREGVVDNFDITPRLRNDYFGFRFTGFIEIPLNGVYTFYTTSDDGSLLFIDDYLVVYNDGNHSAQERSGSIYLDAGMHSIKVEYFEGNVDEVLFVSYEGPGITKRAIPNEVLCSSTINNDMQDQMKNVNASLWTRIEFQAEDTHLSDMLALRIRYEDGFVAYINGVEVERRNFVGTPQWDSTALSNRPIEDSAVFEEFNLMDYLDTLQNGLNVLAIHGLNDKKDNDEFRILPELITAVNRAVPQYFTKPTPDTFNVSGAMGAVSDVWVSTEGTFYTGPPDWHIPLTLSTATDGAEIRYTLDGSRPTMTHGLVFNPLTDPPLEIDKSTILRAVAVKPGWLDSKVETHTYFFPDDVVKQSPNGEAPGPDWPMGSVNGQTINYGMDPCIVYDPVYGGQLKGALKAIPTISLVTDLANLFDPAIGIYVNAQLHGREWERPVSVALINPDGSEGFQVDGGLRIRGGYSRSDGNPKHAFRLFFRAEYGETKLRYPLFGDEGTDEFDHVDLRCSQNYSWSFDGSSRNSMVREVFSRDLQGDMGHPYTRSRYYHLYINGHYWGLYMTQERSEGSFAESYMGGDKEDYDVVKTDWEISRRMSATDGNMDAYQRLYGEAYDAYWNGYWSNADYFRIQGLNLDGTPNPAYEKLLDVDGLIDYMIIEYYSGDRDGPGSRYGNIPNNTWSIYNRVIPDGWKPMQHDSEHSLGTGEWNLVTPFTWAGDEWGYFNPHWLHEQLAILNAEYRLHFADHVQKHLFNGGLLSPEVAIARIDKRATKIDSAVIAESARWGDSKREPPYTRLYWLNEVQNVRNWITNRNPDLIYQFRYYVELEGSSPWFPQIDAPTFNQHGGEVASGFDVIMYNPNVSGNIYYTLNGSDPRQALSGNPIGTKYTGPINLAKSTHVKARVLDGGTWSALNEVIFAIGSAIEDLRITEIMYHPRYTGNPSDPNEEFIELTNIGQDTLEINLVRFTEGIDFTFPDMDLDPGECVVVVKNQAAFQAQYGTSVNIAGKYTGSLANDGEGIKLVDAIGRTILDFEYKDGWRSITDGDGFSLTMIEPGDAAIYGSEEGLTAHWKLDDGTGGTAVDSVGSNHGTLNGDAAWTTGRFDGALSLDGDDDYVSLASIDELTGDTLTMQAWVRLSELAGASNPILTQRVVSMTNDGYYFYVANDKPTFYLIDGFSSAQAISPETISRDQWVHIAGTNDGSNLKLYVNGELKTSASSTGLTGVINDAYVGRDISSPYYYTGLIDDVRIYDRAVSESEFELISDPLGRWSQKDSWRASVYRNGTPGWDDRDILPNPGAIVINEVMSHSNDGPDWIELYNTTSESINIGGWFLSDNNRDEPNLMKYRIA